MDREAVIRMAREAGLVYGSDEKPLGSVIRFAALVASAEREACAKLAEEPYEFTSEEAHRIASAIRARGEQ